MAFAALTVDLNARIAKFEQDMARANKSLDGLSNRATAAGTAMRTAFGALGGTLAVGALASFAKTGIDAADSLNDMSQRLKVSVKDLASFKLISEQSGTSLEGIGAGIGELTKSIGLAERGNKKMAAALTELGITARDPKEAFFQLADAVQRIEDPSTRAALLSRVLKGSYEELIPLLSQGGAALRESAKDSATFAETMARLAPNADAFNDEMGRLRQNLDGLGAQIASEAVRPMAEWLGATNKLIERHGVLIGTLAALGAAAVPGVTAAELAGSVSVNQFREELEKARKELRTIDAATKSGTFGLIQLALYGSEAEMRRKGEYLRSNIKTLEASIRQYEQRIAMHAWNSTRTSIRLEKTESQVGSVGVLTAGNRRRAAAKGEGISEGILSGHQREFIEWQGLRRCIRFVSGRHRIPMQKTKKRHRPLLSFSSFDCCHPTEVRWRPHGDSNPGYRCESVVS